MIKALGGRGTLVPAAFGAFLAAGVAFRGVTAVRGGMGPVGIKMTELAHALTMNAKEALLASLICQYRYVALAKQSHLLYVLLQNCHSFGAQKADLGERYHGLRSTRPQLLLHTVKGLDEIAQELTCMCW